MKSYNLLDFFSTETGKTVEKNKKRIGIGAMKATFN